MQPPVNPSAASCCPRFGQRNPTSWPWLRVTFPSGEISVNKSNPMIISVWRLIICHIMIYQLSTYYFIIFYIHTSLSGPSRSFYTNNNATSMVATTTFPGWPNGAPGHALQQLVHPLIGFGQGISFAGQSLCGNWGRYRKLPMSGNLQDADFSAIHTYR